jgi:hypothetical protein
MVLTLHPLSRGDSSVVYNCCWPSPAQSFSGPNPAELMATFYSIRFETPPTRCARYPYLYPPGTGWPGYTVGTEFPFRRLLLLYGADCAASRSGNFTAADIARITIAYKVGWASVPFWTPRRREECITLGGN